MKSSNWLLTLLAFSSCVLPALSRDPEQVPEPERKVEAKAQPVDDEQLLIVGGIEVLSSTVNNLVKGDSQPVLALCTMNDKGTVISVNGITKSLEQFLDKDFKAIKEKAKRDVHLVIAVIVKDEVLPWKNFRKIQEVANSKEVSEYTIVRFRFAEPKAEAK